MPDLPLLNSGVVLRHWYRSYKAEFDETSDLVVHRRWFLCPSLRFVQGIISLGWLCGGGFWTISTMISIRHDSSFAWWRLETRGQDASTRSHACRRYNYRDKYQVDAGN